LRFVEKYRPKTWDEVVGQKEIVEAIRQTLANPDALPHFLFLGQRRTWYRYRTHENKKVSPYERATHNFP